MAIRSSVNGLTAAVVALGFGIFASPASAQTAPARTVLALHWGQEAFPGTDTIDGAARSALLSRTDIPINYFAEYLETEEFKPETASIALRDYIKKKFDGRHIDVVLTNASAALQFALRYRDDLFPGVPIVFSSVVIPEVTVEKRPPGVTGLVSEFSIADTLQLALTLHPSIKRVYVIAQAPSVKGYDDTVRATLYDFTERVELVYIQEPTVPRLLAAVKGIQAPGLILYTRYAPTEPGQVMYPDEVARLVADVAPVPMYGTSESYLGIGAVGGIMRDRFKIGTRLGEIAGAILAGTRPDTIPITKGPTSAVFDWRQIQRWGIDTSLLPPGSDVRFRTLTTWEAYRSYIVGTIVVVSAQLLLIAGLLMQRTRRRRAEETIRARESSLRASYERIRQLAGRLIHAQETARVTIARDLHDDVSQRLAHVSAAVDSLKRTSGDIQDPVNQEALDELGREAHSTVEGIRRLSHDLHPATLRVLGLGPALKAHCAEVAKRYNVRTTFTPKQELGHLHADVAACFFRIAQEALRNGVVHGGARHLDVSVDASATSVEMIVADDGRGFDLEMARREGTGLGLVSMEERAHMIGGNVQILTAPQRGTTVRVRGPVEPNYQSASPDVSLSA